MPNGLPLATSTWDDEEYAALDRVIKSGKFSMGKEVSKFELEFAQYIGSRFAVMVNSGSSANLLAVAALFFRKDDPLKAGDEVIVPAVSWSTTYFPLQQYGLRVKFIDVDIDTLNIDLDALEAAISPSTRAIFAVNLLGNPIDYTRLSEIIGGKDILIIEDNCESLGASFDSKYCGTFGVIGTFSSFFSHHISTMEGGLAVTDDEELFHIMLSLRAHGWTRNLPEENLICEKSTDPFEESFRFVLPGYNLRPLEMSGALGQAQLGKLASIVAGRRQNADVFQELFADDSRFSIQKETGLSSWFGFALIIKDDATDRRLLLQQLRNEGIETRPIVTGNFVRNDVIRYFDYEQLGDLENADRIDRRGYFVGNHHFDISDKLEVLKHTLHKCGI